MAICSECQGLKYVLNTYDCERCKGTGVLTIRDRLGNAYTRPCPACDHGRVYIEELCEECNGTGIV